MTTSSRKKTERAKEPSSEKNPIVTEVGNLTSDPQLRYSATGTAYCWMRLAVSSPVKPGDWTGERTTDFYSVTAFGSLAEHAAESLRKGDRILITGTAETSTWTDRDGSEREDKRIVAEALGPDLRWATAIARTSTRKRGKSKPRDTRRGPTAAGVRSQAASPGPERGEGG